MAECFNFHFGDVSDDFEGIESIARHYNCRYDGVGVLLIMMIIAFVAIFSNGIFWKTNNDVDVDVDVDDDVDQKYWQPITTIARHLLDPVPRISAKQLTWSDYTGWK